MPIMAPRTASDRPWFKKFHTQKQPQIATENGAINRGISTYLTLISIRPPCLTPPHHDEHNVLPRIWRWFYPPGQPSIFSLTPPSSSDLSCQHSSCTKTTTPSHRHRTRCSAHQRSLRHQRHRHQHVHTNSPHFAPRPQKHGIRWLLAQLQFFLIKLSV